MRDSLPLPKVLIVNDDASTLLALSSILTGLTESLSYTVFMVQSGEEALRKVLKHDFAVILLDVSMPVMDGFETAEAIRSHPRSASVPIIFITAFRGDEINRLKGYQKGAVDYLFAPIIPEVVKAKVAVFVELYLKTLELEYKTSALQAINSDLRIQRLMDLERVNATLNAEIAERRLAQQRADEYSARDSLTELMNRRALLEYLENIIPTSSPESLALLCLDLEGLKKINCLFGYETGDSLLKQMAASLTAVVKDSGVVARIGDDEFAVLLKGFSTADEVIAVAKNIIQSHSELDKTIHKTSINLGISFYPTDGNTAAILFNNTCKAMHFAKQEGCSLKHFQDI